jgi:cell division protein DivIC
MFFISAIFAKELYTMFKKIIHYLKPLVRNYYLMTGLFFVVWMIFFDSNNILTQRKNQKILKELVQQKEYLERGIASNKAMVRQLTNPKDQRALEKFARENYLLKRPNEDIFLIVKEQPKKD